MKSFSTLLLISSLSVFPVLSHAVEFSVAGSVLGERVKIGGESFTPLLAEVEFAAAHLESGLGISLHVGQGFREDETVGVAMNIDTQNSVFINYISRYEDDYRVTLSAGYTVLEIDARNQAGFPGVQEYEGTSFAISAQEARFLGVKDLSLIGSFRHLFDDDELTIQSLSLGVRYAF